ncbi:phosphatidate cytidylyltransferase [Saprospira grandis]|uniref:Phosphatidate cytidylyltransferase n=1 Tax=Saprospira grandis (strain Lewin) TaxID=984262 RepID=H6L2B8_SAPGL|nr:phosphatidate cytidylyltransferase [Saprospira grandis]AFC24756.1 phosphatidate cytidylyltransferase [Saprospira grandis str. Lewin]
MSLRLRTTTALVFGVVMIAGTLAHPISAAALYLLVGFLCIRELGQLLLQQDSPQKIYNQLRRALFMLLSILPALLLVDGYLSPFPLVLNGLGHWFLPLYSLPFLLELAASSKNPFQNIAYSYLGLFYIGLPTFLLCFLSLQDSSGRFLIMAIMLLVWANDVFAYLTGRKLGKRRISPILSPNKTLEGLIGGFTAALLWGFASYFVWSILDFSLSTWLILAAEASIFAFWGDLIASMLKRSLNIKDTGTTLPGHGGLIDRFDAFLFVFPVITFTIIFILKIARFIPF